MSFINFKGIVKKVNLKSAEETEVTISIPASELHGQYNTLQSMLDCKVIGGFDSQIVTYNILKNARTGKPITSYVVDNTGLVSVAKPDGEQLSLDLGLPPEKIEIKQDPASIDMAIIEEFILSGLAPTFDDLDHDFIEITGRLSEGDTYLKLAGEEDMGVGIFVMMVDEYRKRVAPLAQKWDEWRNGEVQAEPAAKDDKDKQAENNAAEEDQVDTGNTPAEETPAEETPEGGGSEGEVEPGTDDSSDLPDWMQEGNDSTGNQEVEFEDPIGSNGEDKYNKGTPSQDSSEPGEPAGLEELKESAEPTANVVVDREELEQFILDNKPMFEDIPFDFPTFLKQRREDGMTWMQIAKGVGIPSTQISSKWTAYKKRVASQMKGGGAA
ncbi:hypothetical protein J2T13_004935 [Paenibacillus sp. DS2015]|uniref:hypothetical protein n=1 Tax=Paenibacillus sp. DS2015 TaxID=3373917 RepID=UPI003D1D30C2